MVKGKFVLFTRLPLTPPIIPAPIRCVVSLERANGAASPPAATGDHLPQGGIPPAATISPTAARHPPAPPLMRHQFSPPEGPPCSGRSSPTAVPRRPSLLCPHQPYGGAASPPATPLLFTAADSVNGLMGEFFVDIGLGLDDITSDGSFDEIIDPNDITMLIKHRNGVSGDNQPPIEEEAQYDTESLHDIIEEEYLDPDDF